MLFPYSYAFFESKSNEVVLVGSNEKDTQNMLSISVKISDLSQLQFYIPKNTGFKRTDTVYRQLHYNWNKPTAYVCENFVCHEPITDGALLREKLNR